MRNSLTVVRPRFVTGAALAEFLVTRCEHPLDRHVHELDDFLG